MEKILDKNNINLKNDYGHYKNIIRYLHHKTKNNNNYPLKSSHLPHIIFILFLF